MEAEDDQTRNKEADEKGHLIGQSVDSTCNMFAEDGQTLNKDATDEGTVNIEDLVQASEEVLPIVPVET
jgi:hypothetical protein